MPCGKQKTTVIEIFSLLQTDPVVCEAKYVAKWTPKTFYDQLLTWKRVATESERSTDNEPMHVILALQI